MRPEVGSASSVSRSSVVCWRTFEMSTTGDSPLTVIVSSTVPTLNSALMVAVNPVVSSSPSRLNVLKPGRVKVTVYTPGPQVDDPVQALTVGDDGADLVDEGRTGGFDGDARQHRARGIAHDSRDRGTIRHLCRCTGWHDEQGPDDENNDDEQRGPRGSHKASLL